MCPSQGSRGICDRVAKPNGDFAFVYLKEFWAIIWETYLKISVRYRDEQTMLERSQYKSLAWSRWEILGGTTPNPMTLGIYLAIIDGDTNRIAPKL